MMAATTSTHPSWPENAVAAGISNLHYPVVNRSFGNAANKWGQQIALDTFFNVAKEFWPDVRNKMFRH
ncbi:MAG TPA: hypothetical protein VIJ38_07685 [Acidobacteriaceae bacterium]